MRSEGEKRYAFSTQAGVQMVRMDDVKRLERSGCEGLSS